jgi:hypothetical protein
METIIFVYFLWTGNRFFCIPLPNKKVFCKKNCLVLSCLKNKKGSFYMYIQQLFFLIFCFSFCFPLFAGNKHTRKKNTTPDVDIVYTWVNSSDPLWQVQRAYYVKQEKGISKDANLSYRFRSRDELKYSLRSIEKYAPFVRKIYIVTNGQKPSWIKTHPKIEFVSHSQIFRHPNHLPTFNSMAIESCLHRIPGLSEYFIYFNDDVFLGRPSTFTSFFTEDGKIRLFLTDRVISKKDPGKNAIGYKISIWNTNNLLSRKFSKQKRYHVGHTPDAERKSLILEIEKLFPKVFASVEGHKFRGLHDYALTNGLIPYTACYLKKGVISKASFEKFVLDGDLEHDQRAMARLEKSPPLFFCIEDCQPAENPMIDALLNQTLENCFPNPAPWE